MCKQHIQYYRYFLQKLILNPFIEDKHRMVPQDHAGSGILYLNRILFSMDEVAMKSYPGSDQQEIYHQLCESGFHPALQPSQRANVLPSPKPSVSGQARSLLSWFLVTGLSLPMGNPTGS